MNAQVFYFIFKENQSRLMSRAYWRLINSRLFWIGRFFNWTLSICQIIKALISSSIVALLKNKYIAYRTVLKLIVAKICQHNKKDLAFLNKFWLFTFQILLVLLRFKDSTWKKSWQLAVWRGSLAPPSLATLWQL